MTSYKKADLSLSVNAIVVLILAIVMLGLALGFVKTMFGKSANQFDEIISTEKEPEQANEYDPIKLSKGTVILKTKENGALKISVFNANQNDFLLADVIDSTNTISTCFATDKLGVPTQAVQQIPSRASKVVGIGFKAPTTPIDTICSICAKGEISASYVPDGTDDADTLPDNAGVPVCTDLHVIVKS